MRPAWALVLTTPFVTACDPVFELELEVTVAPETQIALEAQMPVELRLRDLTNNTGTVRRLGALCSVSDTDARFEFRDAGVCGEETTFEAYFVAVDTCEPDPQVVAESENEARVGPDARVSFFEGSTAGRSSQCGEGRERKQIRFD